MNNIYVFHATDTNLYKIGKARDVQARLKQLQTGSAHKLTVYLSIPTFFADSLEKLLHQKFEHYNEHGEWFYFENPEEINMFLDWPYIENGALTLKIDGIRNQVYIIDSSGHRLSTGCCTYGELEHETWRMIESLIRVLSVARHRSDEPLLVTRKEMEQAWNEFRPDRSDSPSKP